MKQKTESITQENEQIDDGMDVVHKHKHTHGICVQSAGWFIFDLFSFSMNLSFGSFIELELTVFYERNIIMMPHKWMIFQKQFSTDFEIISNDFRPFLNHFYCYKLSNLANLWHDFITRGSESDSDKRIIISSMAKLINLFS